MKKKIVKESLNENIKIEGHEYVVFKFDGGDVYASKEGILGDNETFVSWELIERLKQYFRDKI